MALVFQHLKMKPAPKLVALVLADHANSDGLCWPSYRRISEFTGMDKRTIQRHVKALLDLGVVSKVRTGHLINDGKKVVRLSNAYVMHAHKLEELSTIDLWKDDAFVYLEDDKKRQSRVGGLSTKPLNNHQSFNHKRWGNVDNSKGVTLDNSREPVSLDEIFEQMVTGEDE